MRGIWLMLGLAIGCSFESRLSPPGDGGPDTPPPPDVPDGMLGRVQAGLIGLWTFDDGGGATVSDSSMIAPPVSPTIADVGQVTWATGTLRVDGAVAINSGFARNRLVEAASAAGAVTLEAWVTPANTTQTGTVALQPARIVCFAPQNAGNHHISIGQLGGTWAAQVRTSAAGIDVHGGPPLAQGAIVLTPTHLVVTADAVGRRFYVNGEKVEDALGGTFGWDPFRAISFAGDPNGQNPWLGTFHLVAMYDRALGDAEVLTNFIAGP